MENEPQTDADEAALTLARRRDVNASDKGTTASGLFKNKIQNRVISVFAIRLLSWMDRSHRIGRRASPSVGEATGLVTQKLYADGRGPCYTYTDDGKLATRKCTGTVPV